MTFGYNRSQHHREFTGEEQIHHYNLLFFIRFCSFCTSTGTCVFFHVARRSCPSFLLDSYKTVNMCSDSMNILNWCLSLWCCYSQTCTHILVPQKPDVSTVSDLSSPSSVGFCPLSSQSTSMALSVHQLCNCEQLPVQNYLHDYTSSSIYRWDSNPSVPISFKLPTAVKLCLISMFT